MRTNGFKGMLTALTAGLLLLAGTGVAAAQEKQEGKQEPQLQQESQPQPEAQPKQEPAKAFSFRVDPLVIGAMNTDVDNPSSKFQEYRDLSSGTLLGFRLLGEGTGDRSLDLNAVHAGREDARYTLNYGVLGRYNILLDYNKIPHHFGNQGHMLFTRTGPGTYEIADPTQAALQGVLTAQFNANRNAITFDFLNRLVSPYLATAQSVDVELERDRTLARVDLGKMGRLAWGLEYTHENRNGTRPYGASFGFNNVTELPEPIDYDTNGAELAGEWSGANSGLRFGYRYSDFANNIPTLYWDNPFRFTSSTDPNAYSAPGSSSVNGSAVGFSDLAPDNKANLLFLTGRSKWGNWFANGSASYNKMKQDDPLLPYTLNSSIVGINFNGSRFDPTNVANLPARSADREADVTQLSALFGTTFATRWGLTFHYRYYDYDNTSDEIEFPGYVRFHAVWEPIARVAAIYSYKRQNLGAEIGWDLTQSSRLALLYDRESWDRENREVDTTDEDIFKLSYDSHPREWFNLHASYENGDRSIGPYHVNAANATFGEPEDPTNLPALRKFDEAARQYDAFNVLAQLLPSDVWSFSFGVNSRADDYDESLFGLQKDDILSYSAEVSYTPGENVSFYLFGQRSDRDVRQRGRQSGATPSTNPLDDWIAKFNEVTDTWGLGLNGKFTAKWSYDVTGNYSKSDGEADFTAFPGGLPLTPPRPLLDLPNYEDIKLLGILGRLEYHIRPNATAGFFYRYEDYTIDSFILQGLQNYLPGALLLNANVGDYTANMLGIDLSLRF
jgi:MtrB/PioB family decaheme-associated outer membrane protein